MWKFADILIDNNQLTEGLKCLQSFNDRDLVLDFEDKPKVFSWDVNQNSDTLINWKLLTFDSQVCNTYW